jgi:hypothetical protein
LSVVVQHSFLVERLSQDKRPAEYDQNRYYAAEMLALVLSLPPELGRREGDEVLD